MIPLDPATSIELVKAAKDYADCILKGPLTEIGGLFADQFGQWRKMNQVRCILQAKAYMEARGVDPTKLLPDIFVPLIEEAGKTDNEEITSMYARLLAAHLDPAQQEKIHPSFAKVLGQLSPLDLKVFNLIEEQEMIVRKLTQLNERPDGVLGSFSIQWAVKEKYGKEISAGLVSMSLENLERLGLTVDDTHLYEITEAVAPAQGLRITRFGNRFLRACSGRESNRDGDELFYQLATNPEPTQELLEKLGMKVQKKKTE